MGGPNAFCVRDPAGRTALLGPDPESPISDRATHELSRIPVATGRGRSCDRLGLAAVIPSARRPNDRRSLGCDAADPAHDRDGDEAGVPRSSVASRTCSYLDEVDRGIPRLTRIELR